MQGRTKNKKVHDGDRAMSYTVRIDRDAFKRGVRDVMTFAPLRDAVKIAGESLVGGDKKSTQGDKKPAPVKRDTLNDRPTRR
jgi:SpoU rRNA methylase family enzyme